MCSFLIFNWIIENIEYINEFLKYRGPDHTNKIHYKKHTFVHNLLHLTGEPTYQPFVDTENEIVALFNGEIYNYKDFGSDYTSDGCCLIDCYKQYKQNFVKQLDGEFTLVLFDFKNNLFMISTDVFATKPLWYSIYGNNLGIST